MADPSVTQVLGLFADWDKIPPLVLAHAAARGTKVHKICTSLALGMPMFAPIPDECAGFVESWQRWFEHVEEVHALEERLYHPIMGYHGQPDIICRMRGEDSFVVVDYKTPAQPQKTWTGQGAAYLALCRVNYAGLPMSRSFTLRLSKTGGQAIVDEHTDHDRYYAAFISALTAWKFFKGE